MFWLFSLSVSVVQTLTVTPCRFLQGQDLEAFKPQTSWLSLITTGRKYAVATKGWFCIEASSATTLCT